MKTPVAPESTNEFMDLTSAVSIVSTVTFNFKAFDSSSREEMTSQDGSFHSQWGRKCWVGSGLRLFLFQWSHLFQVICLQVK